MSISKEQLIEFFQKGLRIEDLLNISNSEMVNGAFRQALTPKYNPAGYTQSILVKAPQTPPASNNHKSTHTSYTRRVVKGDVLRLLQTGPAKLQDIARAAGLPHPLTRKTLVKSRTEGLTVLRGDFWALTERGDNYTTRLQSRMFLPGPELTAFNQEVPLVK